MGHFVNEGSIVANALRASRVKITVFLSFVLIASVFLGSIMYMTESDHNPQIQNIPQGIYWAIETVTTVGYGDVTPANPSGRIIAAFVMFEGIAFVTIIVAAVTSIFVARASKERDIAEAADDEKKEARLEAQLHRIDERLERLEKMLRSGSV